MTDFDKRAQDHVEGRPDDSWKEPYQSPFASRVRFVPADQTDIKAQHHAEVLNAELFRMNVKYDFARQYQPIHGGRWTRQRDSQTGSEGWVEITDEPS